MGWNQKKAMVHQSSLQKELKRNFLWQHQVSNPLPLERYAALNLLSGFFREMCKLGKRLSKIRQILEKDRHLHPKQQSSMREQLSGRTSSHFYIFYKPKHSAEKR